MKETFQLDGAHTVIGFSAVHLGVTAVRGRFSRFGGSFQADRADLGRASGEVTVDVGSIYTGDEQRDAHLRSPDFFDSERFPAMTFRLTNVAPSVRDEYLVEGHLTIKETTRLVSLQATLLGETPDPLGSGSRIGTRASGRLDRRDFGLDWSGFAGNVPFAGHTVELQIDAELIATPLSGQLSGGGLDDLLGRLNERELEDLRQALQQLTTALEHRIGSDHAPAEGSGGAQKGMARRILGRLGARRG
jgi:polyisoprenoid-binding protein YceI